MQKITTAFIDEVKETIDPRRDTEEGHLDEMMIIILNFIESCIFYITIYPIVFLCIYLLLIIYAIYWVYSESTLWHNLTDKLPPKRRHKLQSGKNLRYSKGRNKVCPSVSERTGSWYIKRKEGSYKRYDCSEWGSYYYPPVPSPHFEGIFDELCRKHPYFGCSNEGLLILGLICVC